MKRWWQSLKARWQRWRAPRYPIITVNWGPGAALTEGWSAKDSRDCGHVSRSFAYDPLREETLCLECYRRTMERQSQVRRTG